MRWAALLVACALARVAAAQPGDPAAALREANQAAIAGDWLHVGELVDPLLAHPLGPADLAEAHRLAGLAAFFAHRTADAEAHFVAYLRLDPDARLDPALVPPEAVTFFDDVRARHAAELRALRPRAHPHFVLELFPPLGQFQNGERAKAWILVGTFATLAIANGTSYAVLRSWCSAADKTCGTHAHAARTLRVVNLASAGALLITYLYGVYDGVVTYRRLSAEPFAAPTADGAVIGVAGHF